MQGSVPPRREEQGDSASDAAAITTFDPGSPSAGFAIPQDSQMLSAWQAQLCLQGHFLKKCLRATTTTPTILHKCSVVEPMLNLRLVSMRKGSPMVALWGSSWTRSELTARVGRIQPLAVVAPFEAGDGAERAVRMLRIVIGGRVASTSAHRPTRVSLDTGVDPAGIFGHRVPGRYLCALASI